MYFNDKSDTNIDKEFGGKSGGGIISIFAKYSKWIIIGVVILILIILLIVLLGNRKRYYITLEGDSVINLYQGDKYDEPGYKGYDNKNNDLTGEVIVNDEAVDTSTIGEYAITYSLHGIKKIRTVNVVDKPIEATYMYLKGDLVVNLHIGDKYEEAGWVVVDTYEPDLNDKVQVDSNVDTSREGSYLIVYRIKNSKGITTSVSRTVVVSN